MMNDPDKGSSPTREAILDAAERLIGVLGYSKTTVEDVARAAGVGKRTVYVYFPSKEEVVLCTIDRIVRRLTARLRALAAAARPRAAALRAMLLDRVLFRFDSVRDYSHGLDELFASLRPAYLARRKAYFDAEAAVFADVLAAGAAAGEFDCPDPSAAAETLLLSTNSLLPYALSARELGRRKGVEARAGRIADMLLHGLCRAVRRGRPLPLP
jgi:AcrR family transcriptional regulator